MKTKRLLFLFVTMLLNITAWADSAIRLHAQYPLYNTKGTVIESGIKVPSDDKTDWVSGDVIYMILDGGDGNKAFKATYDGTTWNFEEWYKNGGMPDFKPEGGTVSFAMYGENLNLSTDAPSNYAPTKTAARALTNYAGGKLGDIMSTYSGAYTVNDKGIVDIFLDFERPMAKIHIIGAYAGAIQIRNHIEGTKPGGMDNSYGTNVNYNTSKSMTLNEVNRFFPNTQTFRDKLSGNNLNGVGNMVYSARPEDSQIIDAVYYGTMEPDDNGDITIVMCTTASTYKGIEGNAALGSNAMVAYWRKFPGKSINPGDNIYIYGPMSEEEATLWTSQGINGEMNFTQASLTLAENQQVNFKPYCKWKAPAPSDRSLTFEISDPSVITLSEDGNTLYTSGPGTSTITATTASGYQSTMTVSVKEVQELVDVTKSTWGTSFSSTYNVGWRFLNNTVVDLVVTRVAMMIPDGSGGYQEVVSQGDLSLLARASNGTASGTLKINEEDVTTLPTSILRIAFTYNGKTYSVDVPFSADINVNGAKYVECYDNESTAEGWTTSREGYYTPTILSENGDYFLSIKQNERSYNSRVITGTILDGKAAEGTDFTLTFDMRLGSSGGGQYAQYPTSVSFMDAANALPVFSMVAKGTASGVAGPGWKVNNTDLEVDLPNSGYTLTDVSQITWCSYQIVRWKGLTFVTITNRETGETILPRQTVEGASTTGGLGNIIFEMKRYRSNFALDNIMLREVADEDVAGIVPVNYTLRYRDENGEEIKSDSIVVSYVGASVTASPMQLHPIMHDSQKYIYHEGNGTITLTEDAVSNVITLVYRKAPIYNYTVNATNSAGEILKTIKVSSGFEGDDLKIPFPTYVIKDEKMWSVEEAYAEYRAHVTLTEDNQVFNIVYAATTIDNVVYYAEAEDVEGMTRYSAGNSEMRSSQAAMGYAEHDVKFTTLEPGNYQLSFVLYAAVLDQERSMTFCLGDHSFTHTASGTNFSLHAFPAFTITEPTDLILKQGGDESCGVDLIYIQRINGEPQFIAELNAADSTLTFKKGIITNSGLMRGWEVSDTKGNIPGWYLYSRYISKVVFDESFADARPKTCKYWFYYLYNLKSISGLENLNTSEVTDMRAMFNKCYNLQNIDVSHFNTSKVTDMSYMFNECESLTSLDVSNFSTSNVTDMTEMFRYCTNLTTIDVSGFDTSNAKSLGWLFCGCFSLEHVDVSHFKTDKTTIMTSMFWNCSSLKNIDVTSFNTENVTSMGWMFVGCSALKTLNLSSFNTNKVSEIKYMLANCSNLSKVYVGKDWNMANVTSGDSIFVDSEKLVGGMGTRYDSDRIDYRYAHIDGGNDAPGYFTDIEAMALRGDANGDGEIGMPDVMFIVNYILGTPDASFNAEAADANQDGEVGMPDVMYIVNYILNGKFPEE